MTSLLMPKATAAWLVDNTKLTFQQIAQFCSLHILEVQAIADGEVGGLMGIDPIANGQITAEEIDRCEQDENTILVLSNKTEELLPKNLRPNRYMPVAKRQDRPDAIAWLIKHHPELNDNQIVRLVSTTKNTIQAIRNRTHHNTQNNKARSPISLGLCTQDELDFAIDASQKLAKKEVIASRA